CQLKKARETRAQKSEAKKNDNNKNELDRQRNRLTSAIQQLSDKKVPAVTLLQLCVIHKI
ncbi:11137_t:CDS:1, partial [Funneliformis geosporum]